MKRPLPQFPPILVICCFCMLQIPSSGASPPLATPPDSLNTVDPERLSYFLNQRETRSNQHKFLFHYSRTRKPTHPVKPEFAPVHPLMRLAAKLASRRMKRLPQMPRPDSRTATVDFPKKDPTTSFGRPFFLFRPRNGRYTDTKVQ
ncbi:neuromedin-S isoform X2 [Grammomys surdaster]|uniref:neuromedin-S isoform X2 n=1 Tax=Grammomys surdaster TaxID=491861 RepID=UPI0010A0926F|nr:neuromedin-S isoform X2 [Grammomys surdaster]